MIPRGIRILVCGSRSWYDYSKIYRVLADFRRDNEMLGGVTVIDGAANGADELAHKAAKALSFKTERFPITDEDWKKHGTAAGPVRNHRMLTEGRPGLVIAFWLDKSPGTGDMLTQAQRADIPCMIYQESNKK